MVDAFNKNAVGATILAQRYGDGARFGGRITAASGESQVCSLDQTVVEGDKLLIRMRVSPPLMYVAEVTEVQGAEQVKLRLRTQPQIYDARLEARHTAIGLSARIAYKGLILHGVLHNFSRAGVSIELSQTVPKGTAVELELPEIGARVEAVSRHSRPLPCGHFVVGFCYDLDERMSSQLLSHMLQATEDASRAA